MEELVAKRIKGLVRSTGWELVEIADQYRDRKDQIRLNVGDIDFPTPDHVVEYANEAIKQGYTHYSIDKGLEELREAIAVKLQQENKVEVHPTEGVIVTIGGTAAIMAAMLAVIDPGDEVLLPSPHFSMLEAIIVIAGAKPVFVPAIQETDFVPDPEELEKFITPRTKAILLTTPNNPTGGVYGKDCLEAIADIVQRHNLVVLSDEVYEKFVFDGAVHHSIGSFPGMEERTITINSFSKAYAMTGWRIGYAAGPRSLISQIVKVHASLAMSVTSFIQKAAVKLLTEPQPFVDEMLAIYKRRRNFLVKELNNMPGITCLSPKGGLYTFPDVRSFGKPSLDLGIYLAREAGVLTRPGSAFGELGEGHIRIVFTASMQEIEIGMERMKAALEKL